MRDTLAFVEDLITEGRSDEQIMAVAFGTSKNIDETKKIIKEVRKNLRTKKKR